VDRVALREVSLFSSVPIHNQSVLVFSVILILTGRTSGRRLGMLKQICLFDYLDGKDSKLFFIFFRFQTDER
jgi:hypothetical protein